MQNNLKKFFNEARDGQDLAHHKTKWYMLGSHIIAFFGKIGNQKTGSKSHTSVIIDIKKGVNVMSFYLLESTYKHGVVYSKKKSVIKMPNGLFITTGFSKNEKLYWSPDVKLNKEDLKQLQLFADNVYGKKYANIHSLTTTYAVRFVKKFVRFIRWFFKVKISDVDFEIEALKDKKTFYCSELSARKDYELRLIKEEDYKNNPYPDPITFFNNKKEVLRVK
jgi:hypothetical protein